MWEQEHQKELSDSFQYELLNGGPENFVSPVRRIICGGCGSIFYMTDEDLDTAMDFINSL